MKLISAFLFSLFGSLAIMAESVSSPNGRISVTVDVNDEGTPFYSVEFDGKTIVNKSALGLKGKQADLSSGFRIVSVERSSADSMWTPVWGEYSQVRDNHNEILVALEKEDPMQKMNIRFRIFDDGFGFRYELPVQDNINYLTVMDEITQFNLTDNHTFFAIPGDYDTDEYLFSEVTISQLPEAMKKYRGKHTESQFIDGGTFVQTPLMIKTPDSLYINIHEAALVGYPAMSLQVDPDSYSLSSHLTPDRLGVKAYLQLPFSTPWRTMIVSDDARDILASQLIYNLNEPSKIEDTSWIKPMKFMGVWWEMFAYRSRGWNYSDYKPAQPGITDYTTLTPNGKHPANTENVKKYIDFAADHNIDAVLVEGWNQGWEDWKSFDKNRQFRFDLPYPDFDVKELRDYAASKGIQLIMHHETAANAADYELQLDSAFRFMKANGYNAVKNGYVGVIIPRAEHHSSQWMLDHVKNVIERAADYKIMVDSHEAPRPTGLSRTYPNWLAQESARGGEFESMGGNPPYHTTILPFTRLKGGPMDYTPGLFETKMSYYGEGNKSQAGTTIARQLALYMTMPSPLQMACDLPENYMRFPDAFAFIEVVPVDWADSKYLEAEPGRYITVARKDKKSEEWYIGAITNEDPRETTIDLSFLPEGIDYEVTIYEDGPDAHWKDNPQSYNIRQLKADRNTVLKQKLAAGGGAAIRLVPLN